MGGVYSSGEVLRWGFCWGFGTYFCNRKWGFRGHIGGRFAHHDDWGKTLEGCSEVHCMDIMALVPEFYHFSPIRLYPCTQCKKPFSRYKILMLHLRTHTREKLYPCTNCTKLFSKDGILKLLLATHRGEKPHTCTQYSTSFPAGRDLKQHMRSHTREKPYLALNVQNHFQ